MSKGKGKAKKEDEPLPFEDAVRKLEGIVEQLEGGDVPLERSLELFEEGVRLSRACLKRLDAAERRIEVLMRDADGGEDREVPFDEPGEE